LGEQVRPAVTLISTFLSLDGRGSLNLFRKKVRVYLGNSKTTLVKIERYKERRTI
jgi:hypothetical protein